MTQATNQQTDHQSSWGERIMRSLDQPSRPHDREEHFRALLARERAQFDLLESLGLRMAQELQELIDDGVDAGREMGATAELLTEWDITYRQIQISAIGHQ